MPSVDPVILKLEADLRQYQRDLSGAQRLTDTKLDAIEARGRRMGESIKGSFSLAKTAAVAFAGSIVVDKVVQAVTAGLEYASSLGEVAQQLGVTTDALQEYRFAATQAGLEQGEMDMALLQLTRRLGEAASGTKAQAEAFAKLGISVKDANGEIIATGDAIPLIADALQRVESPAERAAILIDLFGKAGQKLEPLLAGGSAAVNELRNAAHELGIVLSSDQIQRADDTADKLAALKTVITARIAGAVSDNAGSILKLANAFAELVNQIGAAVKAFERFSNSKIGRGIADAAMGRDPLDLGKLNDVNRGIPKYPSASGGAPTPAKPKGFFPTLRGMVTPKTSRLGGADSFAPTNSFAARIATFAPGAMQGALEAISKNDIPAASVAIKGATAEFMRLEADLALARAELTGSISERAAAEKQRIAADLAAEIERTKADTDLTAAQRDKVMAIQREKAAILSQMVDKEAEAEAAKRASEAEADRVRIKLDALESEQAAVSAEAEAATTTSERHMLERRLLQLQQEEERARLEAAIAAGQIADAAGERAKLARRQASDNSSLDRSQEGPGKAYLRDLAKDAEGFNEALQQIEVDGLKSLNDGLVDAIMGAKSLGDVFKNVANQIVADLLRIAIQKAVIGPLADALFGGGEGLGGLVGSIFGRASGGYVAPGQMVRVNEGARPGRVEGFMSRDGGKIIPLGQMDALRRGGAESGGTAVVRLELSGDIDARIQSVSGPVAVEVVRAAAPQIVDASAREAFARAGRPKL